MAKVLFCGDIVPGCSAKVEAASQEDALAQAAEHAKAAHGVERPDAALLEKMKSALKDR